MADASQAKSPSAPVVAFDLRLYRADAVDAALAAYATLVRATSTAHGHDLVVTIEPLEGEDELPDDVADAFANHVLFESIVKRGVA